MREETSGFAIASLILGIVSIIIGWIPVVGWILSLAGLIIGIIAIGSINKKRNLEGKGFAIAGTTLSSVALIIWILIPSLIFGVFIAQTSSELQQKAFETGQMSKNQVSTTISPILLFAEDGSSQTLSDFYLKAKLAPGSDPIKLSELLLSFDLQNKTADLSYSTGSCTASSATGFATNGATGKGNFTVTYLISSSNMVNGYIQRGDIVEFCFASPRPVNEDENIDIELIPKVGTPTTINAATPNIINEQRLVLYP